MDNVKDDRYFLEKITSDLKFVIDHTQGMTQEEMTENDLLIDSVMFRIVQVAENGAKLSNAFPRRIPISLGQPSAGCATASCTITAS